MASHLCEVCGMLKFSEDENDLNADMKLEQRI